LSKSSAKAPSSNTPTIIDAGAVVRALTVTLLLWFAGMALLATVWEPPVVAVFGPPAAILSDPGLKIVTLRAGVATVAGQGHGWVRRLYADGAWFVWPITASGCAGLRSWITK
jgi:hypothetical protein